MNEEQIIEARFKDLAKRAYTQNIYTFTGFLSLDKQSVLQDMKGELDYIGFTLNGGNEICEKQMACFGNPDTFGYEPQWPISLVRVVPLIEKFSDELTHRDFLGAIMNLGIDREVIGDIIVKDKKRAFIFCQDNMTQFLVDNITKIKHTNVRCEPVSDDEAQELLKPELKDIECIVASDRLDAIIAALIKCSRSEALALFKSRRVFVNGRCCERNSLALKAGDIFSVRGHGKYIFCSEGAVTRKGRLYINVKQYI